MQKLYRDNIGCRMTYLWSVMIVPPSSLPSGDDIIAEFVDASSVASVVLLSFLVFQVIQGTVEFVIVASRLTMKEHNKI